MKKYVVPYLKDQTSLEGGINGARFSMRGVNHKVIQSNVMEVEPSTAPLLDGSLSYSWPAQFKTFMGEFIGIKEEEST